MIRTTILALFLTSAIALLAADAPIQVKDAWVLAVPPSSSATAAFLTIVNTSDQPVQLTRCVTPVAGQSAPMITTRQTVDGHEVMGMETVESLEIPAGGERKLAPGGDHLMLMELKSVPKAGENIELTLTFEPGAHEVKLSLPVRRSDEK